MDQKIRDKLVTLLRKYAAVCDRRLGNIKGACNRIDIVPGSKSIFQQPNRCEIERRKAEEAEIQRMLNAGVIAPVKRRMGKSSGLRTETRWIFPLLRRLPEAK